MKKILLCYFFVVSLIQLPLPVSGGSMTSQDDGPCVGLPAPHPLASEMLIGSTDQLYHKNSVLQIANLDSLSYLFMNYYADYFVYTAYWPEDITLPENLYFVAHLGATLEPNSILGQASVLFRELGNPSQIPGLLMSYRQIIFLSGIDELNPPCGQLNYNVTLATLENTGFVPFDPSTISGSSYYSLLDFNTLTFPSYYNLACIPKLQTWTEDSGIGNNYFQNYNLENSEKGLKQKSNNPISKFAILKPYPNPTTNAFQVDLFVEESTRGSIEIYNLNGKLLFREEELYLSGSHSSKFNLGLYPTGLYIVKLKMNDQEITHQVLKN